MQCLAILVYIYWCLNLQLPLPHPQFMWNLYFEGWRKLCIEHVRLFATVLCEGGRASFLPLKVQHLVPCEDRYRKLWWIMLVRNNVPSAAQGLVKIFPYLYVIRCDCRGGTCLSRLGMGICMERWMLGFPCSHAGFICWLPQWSYFIIELTVAHCRVECSLKYSVVLLACVICELTTVKVVEKDRRKCCLVPITMSIFNN
jgi:hypothetical protein